MNEKINLNGSTKLSELLAAYPDLRRQLPRINDKFKLLDSPLGTVMLKTATISEMSKRSGVAEDCLIHKLGSLIEARE